MEIIDTRGVPPPPPPPPSVEQLRFTLKQIQEKAASWDRRIRELPALLAEAEKRQREHDQAIEKLKAEMGRIERLPHDSMYLAEYGQPEYGVDQQQVNRYHRCREEIGERERRHREWIEAATVHGWDRWGKSRPWSPRRVADVVQKQVEATYIRGQVQAELEDLERRLAAAEGA